MANIFSRMFGAAQQTGWIEPPALAAALERAEPLALIDVRGSAEFTGPLGHIDGAVNLPLDQFASRIDDLRRETRPIVLVCHTDRRSSAAAAQLQAAGVQSVSVLRGGMVAWRAIRPS